MSQHVLFAGEAGLWGSAHLCHDWGTPSEEKPKVIDPFWISFDRKRRIYVGAGLQSQALLLPISSCNGL